MLLSLSQCMCRGRRPGRPCAQPEMGMGRSLQSMFLNMEQRTLCFGKSASALKGLAIIDLVHALIQLYSTLHFKGSYFLAMEGTSCSNYRRGFIGQDMRDRN